MTYLLIPIPVTDTTLTSCSIAEPAAGELAWASGGTYVMGDQRILVSTHKVYEASIGHTGRTVSPALDKSYWFEVGPTKRWAALDGYISTQSVDVTSLSYVMHLGFFNAVFLYGLEGATVNLSVKDAPGGTEFLNVTTDLMNLPLDWYDWSFGQIRSRSKVFFTDILPYPDAELTVTVTAAAGVPVKIGMIAVGDLRPLMGEAAFGGTKKGPKAEPVDLSIVDVDKYGNIKIFKGRSATDLRFEVVMPQSSADFFLANTQEALSIPAVVIATLAPGYDGLNCFGLLTGSMSYDDKSVATYSGYVKGTT